MALPFPTYGKKADLTPSGPSSPNGVGALPTGLGAGHMYDPNQGMAWQGTDDQLKQYQWERHGAVWDDKDAGYVNFGNKAGGNAGSYADAQAKYDASLAARGARPPHGGPSVGGMPQVGPPGPPPGYATHGQEAFQPGGSQYGRDGGMGGLMGSDPIMQMLGQQLWDAALKRRQNWHTRRDQRGLFE